MMNPVHFTCDFCLQKLNVLLQQLQVVASGRITNPFAIDRSMHKKKVCLTVIHHFCPVQKVSLEMLTLIVWLKHRSSDPLVRVASPDKQLIHWSWHPLDWFRTTRERRRMIGTRPTVTLWRICTAPPTMTWHEIGRCMWRVTCPPDLEVMCHPSVMTFSSATRRLIARKRPSAMIPIVMPGLPSRTTLQAFQPHLCPVEHASRRALASFRMMAPPPCWSLLGAWSPHVTSRSVIAALHPPWLKVHHASTPNAWIEQVQEALVGELHDEVCNRARTCNVSPLSRCWQQDILHHQKGHRASGRSWRLSLP